MQASLLNAKATCPYDSDISTADTIAEMKKIVRESLNSPQITSACLRACAKLGEKPNDKEIICAIFYWIKRNIRFASDPELNSKFFKHSIDPNNVELLVLPESLVSIPGASGDCDDFAMLAAVMLLKMGIPCRFVTVAADPNFPEHFSHVYNEAFLIDEWEWMPFDCSYGQFPGWEYLKITRRKVWDILDGSTIY
jgi:transglutaminase-like putative cysteine protease